MTEQNSLEELQNKIEKLEEEIEALKASKDAYRTSYYYQKSSEIDFSVIAMKFKSVFDSSPIGILLYDDNGMITDVNKRYMDIFGLSTFSQIRKVNLFKDTVISRSLLKDIKKGKTVIFETEYDFNIQGKESFVASSKSGVIYLRIIISALFIENSKEILGYLFQIEDRSMSAKSNRALIQSKENFISFFNTIDEMLFVLDEAGNVLRVNNAVIEKLGYKATELIDKNVINIHPEDKREEAATIVKNMLEGNAKFCPIPLVSKTGEHIPVETRVVKGMWNNEPALFGISKDISELKKTERMFETIFKTNPAMMAISEIETGRIVDVNTKFIEVLGFDESELIGSTTQELNIFADYNNRLEALEILKSVGCVKDYKLEIKKKDGSLLTTRFSADTIEIQGTKYLLSVVIDETSQISAESGFLRQTERLNGIFEATQSGIVLIEKDTHIISDINPAALDILKFSREKIIGSNCNDYMCPAGNNCCPITNFHRTIINEESTILNADGVAIPILKSVIEKKIGAKTYLIESFIDISSRKDIEKQLIQSEQKYRKIFENIQDVFFQSDLEGKLIEISPSIERYSGVKRENLIGMLSEEIYKNPSDRAKMIEIVNRDGEVVDYEIEFKTNSEISRTASLNAHPLKNEAGDIVGIEGSLRDITERKNIERALYQSKEEIRTILSVLPIGITLTNSSGEIIETNKVAEQLLHISESKNQKNVLENDYLVAYHHDHTEMTQEEFANIIAFNQGSTIMDVRIGLEYNENLTWLNVCSTPLPGSIGGVVATYSDITSLVKAEEELTRLNYEITTNKIILEENQFELFQTIQKLEESEEKLIEALDVKDKFFSIIAHDLKSPFSGLLGISGLMSKSIETLSIQDLKDMATALYNSAQSTFQLLNELLDWSRLQNKTISYEPDDYYLDEILLEAASLLQTQADLKKIKLNYQIEPGLIIYCDKIMLATVLRNLISNAIKFSYPNSEIIVKVANIENCFDISVIDNGVGIPESKIEQLFQIAKIFSTPGTAKEKGSGLGLILCKEFVEKHNGTIEVESRENMGAKFRVRLPLKEIVEI